MRLRGKLPGWADVRTGALSLSGFGCLTAAAWTINTALGLAAAGISFLIVEYLAEDGDG